MRLKKAEHDHSLSTKLVFVVIRLMTRRPVPDVVKTLKCGSAFFGRAWNPLADEVLRGPSEWSVGERELFAAFVSRQNQCVF
jgi:hypothetical protein